MLTHSVSYSALTETLCNTGTILSRKQNSQERWRLSVPVDRRQRINTDDRH